MDSYQNFVKKETVTRYIIKIDARIDGRLQFNNNNISINDNNTTYLPIDK